MATVLKKPMSRSSASAGWGDHGQELTEAGLNVVALELTRCRHWPDGAYPQVIDERPTTSAASCSGSVEKHRHHPAHNTGQQAVPYRQLAAFLPGTGVGSTGLPLIHFRVDIPLSCGCAAAMKERYGKSHPRGCRSSSFGVTYSELEPFFDKAEKVFGTSGRTVDQRQGGRQGRGDAFAPDRSDDFPLPAQKNTGRRSCLKKRRAGRWVSPPITCRRPIPPTPIPTRRARWADATSAVSAAATPATCTLKASPNEHSAGAAPRGKT